MMYNRNKKLVHLGEVPWGQEITMLTKEKVRGFSCIIAQICNARVNEFFPLSWHVICNWHGCCHCKYGIIAPEGADIGHKPSGA